jgi:hypothetical protein
MIVYGTDSAWAQIRGETRQNVQTVVVVALLVSQDVLEQHSPSAADLA